METELTGLFPHMSLQIYPMNNVVLTESGRGKFRLEVGEQNQARAPSGGHTGFVLRSPVPNDTPVTSKVKSMPPTLRFLFQRSHTQTKSITGLHINFSRLYVSVNSRTLHGKPISLRTGA